MNKKLRFIISVSLMLCFGISAMLYVFLDVAQLHYKVVAAGRIEDGVSLQTLRLSLYEFNNTKEDELWYKGALYDIKSHVIINDSVFVSVLRDDEEAQLVKNIAESFELNGRNVNDGFSHVFKYHFHSFDGGKILPRPYRIAANLAFYSSYCTESRSTSYLAASAPDVIKPPPQGLCRLLS